MTGVVRDGILSRSGSMKYQPFHEFILPVTIQRKSGVYSTPDFVRAVAFPCWDANSGAAFKMHASHRHGHHAGEASCFKDYDS